MCSQDHEHVVPRHTGAWGWMMLTPVTPPCSYHQPFRELCPSWSHAETPVPHLAFENALLKSTWSSVPGASTGDPTHDKVMQRDLTGKASQVSRGPLPEHLPQNQNLSVYCLLHCTLLTLQGAIPDQLSLEKVNLELQLVSCIWKECFGSNPSDGFLTCLTVGDFYNLWLFTAPQPREARSLKYLKDIEPFRAKN